MKTAVSIPDDIFQNAERLARRTKQSRSEVYSRALSEYVSRHSLDETTVAMNAALEDIGDTRDAFVATSVRKLIERTEWCLHGVVIARSGDCTGRCMVGGFARSCRFRPRIAPASGGRAG
jgi:predicted transcriptional regulator